MVECVSPTPRSHASLTPHPTANKLVLFGGEFHSGNKAILFNDLYIFDIDTQQWFKHVTEKQPVARSSHQAAGFDADGGQLWIFGGETILKSRIQHKGDLWVFRFSENRWEEVQCSGGPSPRSGHRMVFFRNHLFVYGGFIDNNKSYTYYNDMHAFRLVDYQWTRITITGDVPSVRSACQMGVVCDKGVVIYGGYSRHKNGKDDVGVTHTDMYSFTPKGGKALGNCLEVVWESRRIAQSGDVPSPRVGMTWVQTPGSNAVAFGGVFDGVQASETLNGYFYNDLYIVSLDTGCWQNDIVRTKKLTRERKRRRLDKGDDSAMETDVACTMSDSTEQLSKKLRLSAAVNTDTSTFSLPPVQPSILTSTDDLDIDMFAPPPRMHPLLAVKGGKLFVFGGVQEDGDDLLTLGDMYSLDLYKLQAWEVITSYQTIKKVRTSKDEDLSDSETSDTGSDTDSSSNTDSSSEMTASNEPQTDEDLSSYMKRTKEYWLNKVRQDSLVDKKRVSARNLHKLANDKAAQYYKSL